MSYTASELLKIASAEIGYKEKKTNSNLEDKSANAGSNNYTKYARDLASAGYYNGSKNGYSWCDVFVDWCFYQLCGKNKKKAEEMECQTGDLGAGCKYSLNYYKNAGRLSMNPQVGDQIFFCYSGTGIAEHTGLVESVTASEITTIEGNSGDKVRRLTYKRTDKTIIGYGHPKYDAEATQAPVPVTNHDIVKLGSKGSSVKEMQERLIALGYSCGKYGADGDFGSSTLTALKKFQKSNSLTVDGICGPLTWSVLLKASSKTVDELAKEVIDGKWGRGETRKKKLTDAGYDYEAVQNRVNEILR